MKVFKLVEFTAIIQDLEKKYESILDNVWTVDQLIETETDVFVREVSQIRVYFDNEKIEEITGIDEFDIINAYYDAMTCKLVVKCMDDADTEKLINFLGAK